MIVLPKTGNSSTAVNLRSIVAGLCISLAGLAFVADTFAANNVATHNEQTPRLYAKVGTAVITLAEYNQSFQRIVRQKFYHSKPPENELLEVRKTVADKLINRQLLLQEASRRELKADEATINKTLEQYDQRYARNARWKQQRETLLKTLRKKLNDDDVLQQLEKQVRNIAPPGNAQLKQFYLNNPAKFTEPIQQKLSLILLPVDPSSAQEVWAAALKKAQALVMQLREGADFVELAAMHSGDVSAKQGGDMGYVHREMLSEAVQTVVDKLKNGEISEAVRVLQGIAILRLDERKAKRLREFNDVLERARRLWLRDKSEFAWAFLKEKLCLDTPVTVYNKMYNERHNKRHNEMQKNKGNDV